MRLSCWTAIQWSLEPDAESAAQVAFRPAAPQIVQPHVVLSLRRELLRQRLPEVYEGLIEAGVAEAPLSSQMPPSLPDCSGWPGDERLTMLKTRRSTLDWVLRRAAVAQPGVGGGMRSRLLQPPLPAAHLGGPAWSRNHPHSRRS